MSKSSSIINFQILNKIQNYIFENDSLHFRMMGFADDIDLYGMRVPSSFDDNTTRAQMKKANFKSAYHLFNQFNQKTGLTMLSEQEIADLVSQELEYWFMHIHFKTPNPEKKTGLLKNKPHTFLIVLYTSEASDELDSFKLIYSDRLFFDYVKCFDEATYIDLDNELTDEHKIAVSNLKIVLGGICKQVEIEIPKNMVPENLHSYLISEVTKEDFETLILLLTRGKIALPDCKKQAKKMFASLNKKKAAGGLPDNFEQTLDVASIVNSYYSDWKFDPEDISYGISEMLDEDFTFTYPNNTYSDDLFPYIQDALGKLNLELMTFDTQGDSYQFFLANKIDVEKIISLANKLRLGIEKIHLP
jgi:hypothetical protein